MAALPPINARSDIEIEDSCNCCWGPRKKKERKLTPAEKAFADKISHADEPKDSSDVYNFNIHVDVSTPKEKRHSHHSKEEKK